MRIALAQVWQETNTFNPIRTTRADFDQFGVTFGNDLLEKMADTNELGGFIQSLRKWPEKPELVIDTTVQPMESSLAALTAYVEPAIVLQAVKDAWAI